MRRIQANALTNDELREIATYEPLRQEWRARNVEDMLEMLQRSYNGRVRVSSESIHGFGGDLFIIQSDDLSIPPANLVRDRHGRLTRIEYIQNQEVPSRLPVADTQPQ
jgi:hypothetical protein